MQVPAYYIPKDGVPQLVHVRIFTKFAPAGDLAGTNLSYAEIQEAEPRVLFMRDEVPMPAVGAIVSVEPGEAYCVDNVLPADDISITAEASRIRESETSSLPVPTTP